MKLFPRKREPKVVPRQELEVDKKHLWLRVVLFAVFLVIGVTALISAITGLFSSQQPEGWQSVTVQTDQASCADEFSLIYEFGRGELSVKREYEQLSELYGEACVKAYRLFSADQTFDGVRGLAELNARPGQTVDLDPALVKALRQADSSGRQLYLGPIYPYYRLIFSGRGDAQTDEYDPARNPEMAAFFEEVLAFANDSASVWLEFTGETGVCLHVSDAYAAYAETHEIYTFVDFHWTKNAFIADYLAETLTAAGFTRGALSSFDGFTRNLDARDNLYALHLYGREGNTVRAAATLQYAGACAVVSLRAFPVVSADGARYSVRADGSVVSPYIDARDGLCRACADHLICRSDALSCGELLLQMIPVYIADDFDPSPLFDGGISTVCCREGEISRFGEGFLLSDVPEGQEIFDLA